MPETTIAYTATEAWRVDLVAFQTGLFVYKAIGATVRAYHWEVGGILWWRKERWVEKPVDFLSVRVSYEGMFVGQDPGAAVRASSSTNASSCDDRLFAFGAGLTWDASAGGAIASGSPTPGPNAKLDVRGARAVAMATVAGEQLTLPEASTGKVFGEGPF